MPVWLADGHTMLEAAADPGKDSRKQHTAGVPKQLPSLFFVLFLGKGGGAPYYQYGIMGRQTLLESLKPWQYLLLWL